MMKKTSEAQSLLQLAWPGLLFCLLLLLVKGAEQSLQVSFYKLGIYPRTFAGLPGIFFSPFIHGDYQHLFSNFFPALLLSFLIFSTLEKQAWSVYLSLFLLSGFWTWCLGRPSYHIGASGFIYGLASFIFFTGLFSKNHRAAALMAFIVIFYEEFIFGIFPTDKQISWEAHLSGFIAGIFIYLFHKKEIIQLFPPKKAKELDYTPPYPYWLYNEPPLVNAKGQVFIPEPIVETTETEENAQQSEAEKDKTSYWGQTTFSATGQKFVYEIRKDSEKNS